MMSIFAVRLVFVFSLRDALSTSTAVFNFNIHFRAGGGRMGWQSSTNHGDMTKGRLCHVPASFSDMGCG
jgi:hypothetical protein